MDDPKDAAYAVHPRVYGEYGIFAPFYLYAVRFTPVCTGNTPSIVENVAFRSVHPRVYGEYFFLQI